MQKFLKNPNKMLASIPFFILPTSLRIRPLLDAKIDLRLNRFFSHAKQACPGCPALRKLQIYFIFLFLPTPKTKLPLDPTMKIFSSFWLFWKNTEKMSTNERHLNNKWMTEIYQKVIYIFIQFFCKSKCLFESSNVFERMHMNGSFRYKNFPFELVVWFGWYLLSFRSFRPKSILLILFYFTP